MTTRQDSRTERAAFYRTALLLGLLRGECVVQWIRPFIGREAPFIDGGQPSAR